MSIQFDSEEYLENMQSVLNDIIDSVYTCSSTNDVDNILHKKLYQLVHENKIIDFAVYVVPDNVEFLIKRKEGDPYVQHPINLKQKLVSYPLTLNNI